MNFTEVIEGIQKVVNEWEQKLLDLPQEIVEQKRNEQNRTIKQILGHLTDSATNNHHRLVRLQYVETLDFPDYWQDNDRWIAIQNFQAASCENLVQFWKCYNLHIIHIIQNVDSQKFENYWTDVQGNQHTLPDLIKGYLWHLNLHMSEIEEIINQ